MQEKLFLVTSKRVARRLTEVFDFIWPTAAAIWNLRWQVRGYVGANPSASEAELSGRFVAGSGISGVNLRRACMETSWQDQQQEFARFLLIEFCALYETWCSGALQELGQADGLAKELQHPTTATARKPTRGVGYALQTVNATPSTVMGTALYAELTRNKKHSKAHLEELLVCYRFFKEARNGIVHGGMVTTRFLTAETAYSQLTPATLGVKEVPAYTSHGLGDKLSLNLRGVVGFGEIVLRLVCTLDAELSVSLPAEAVFISRWKETHGRGPLSVASDANRRTGRIRRLVRQMDMPTPSVNAQFESWLRTKSLIT